MPDLHAISAINAMSGQELDALVPGAIQPHVAMLAVDPVRLTIGACSDNIADAIVLAPAAVIGRALREILPAAVADELLAHMPRADRPWRMRARLGERAFALTAHRHAGRLIVEFELLPARPADFAAATPPQAQDAVARLLAAASLADAAQGCADDLRAMTGFEHVLIWRFDAGGPGAAMAESRAAGFPSLPGLRPEPDVAAQAPALFVVDRDAPPSAILAASADDGPVDLGFAHARASPPGQLAEQRARGVNGSMAIPIAVAGVRWGLVIGHHRRPHYVDPDTRALAAIVTDAFALRVRAQATAPAAGVERGMLTREIDHRVKNSLQSVAGIILVQARRAADPDARAAFQNAYGRIMSIARIHDSLRHSDDASTADLGETLRRLCADLSSGIADAGRRIDVDTGAGLMVPSRTAIALATIATELVTNALKHAYLPDEGGTIEVRLRARAEGGLALTVSDEGRGLPPHWDDRAHAKEALGMRIVGAMVAQIGAALSVDIGRTRGAAFTVTT